MKELRRHPLSAAWPDMNEEEYADLKKSIGKHGVREPIYIYQGQILDGHHRYQACMELGVSCPHVDFPEGHDPVDYVIDRNANRRSLTVSERTRSVLLCVEWRDGAAGRPRADEEKGGHDGTLMQTLTETGEEATPPLEEDEAGEPSQEEADAFQDDLEDDLPEDSDPKPSEAHGWPAKDQLPEPPKPIATNKEIAEMAGGSVRTVKRVKQQLRVERGETPPAPKPERKTSPLTDQVRDLRAALGRERSRIVEMEQVIQDLTTQRNELAQNADPETQDAISEMRGVQADNAMLRSRVSELQSKLNDQNGEIRALRKQAKDIDALKFRVAELELALTEARDT